MPSVECHRAVPDAASTYSFEMPSSWAPTAMVTPDSTTEEVPSAVTLTVSMLPRANTVETLHAGRSMPAGACGGLPHHWPLVLTETRLLYLGSTHLGAFEHARPKTIAERMATMAWTHHPMLQGRVGWMQGAQSRDMVTVSRCAEPSW